MIAVVIFINAIFLAIIIAASFTARQNDNHDEVKKIVDIIELTRAIEKLRVIE